VFSEIRWLATPEMVDDIAMPCLAAASANAEIHLFLFTQKSLKKAKDPDICVLLLI